MAFFTAIVASFLGTVLSVAGRGPSWATFLAFTLYAGTILGWCAYCEFRGDKPL
jgi:hypothetical protein